jgi:hypothetical protein
MDVNFRNSFHKRDLGQRKGNKNECRCHESIDYMFKAQDRTFHVKIPAKQELGSIAALRHPSGSFWSPRNYANCSSKSAPPSFL